MSLRTARSLAIGYFLAMLLFVTWPGLVPFARVRPLVLGLPFSMAWIAGWIAGGVGVLWFLDRVEARYRRTGAMDEVGPTESGGPGTRRAPPAGSKPSDADGPARSQGQPETGGQETREGA